MNIAVMKVGLKQLACRSGLLLKKYAPQILVGTGVVGFVGTVVVGCKATLKVDEILEEQEDRLNKVETVHNDPEQTDYSEEDYEKDKRIVKTQTMWKFVKLYAPTVTLGATSIVLVLSGHHILGKRTAAITAAYKAVETGFNEYRKRVVDQFGENVDYQLRNGLKAEEMQTEQALRKAEHGTTKEDKKAAKELRKQIPGNRSRYARIFDEYSSKYQADPEMAMAFLKTQERWANDMLQIRGHVMLNEVYDMLGMERTKEGCVVGWVLNKGHKGDNYISFGLDNLSENTIRQFVAQKQDEPYIWLDFNVDGVVYDLI